MRDDVIASFFYCFPLSLSPSCYRCKVKSFKKKKRLGFKASAVFGVIANHLTQIIHFSGASVSS